MHINKLKMLQDHDAIMIEKLRIRQLRDMNH